jgi:UDP-4-amino-4,6-dideoxy-N-acetyl-beta-L-altrosamine transaminase
VSPIIPYGRQDISPADIQAVADVLASDWLTQGPTVDRFEEAVAAACGAAHGVAVNSATAALHLACRVLGLGPGDRLWTSPNTFVASANCGLYCGATVDFVDIDPRTYTMAVDALAQKLEAAERDGTLPKVLIPVHFAGAPCEMEAIAALCRRYGVAIVEDASHGIGGRYAGEPLGACTYSDMTVFSFHPVKIITTGEGGMVLTNRPAYAEQLKLLRSHGITRDPNRMTEESHGPWYYQQVDLGYNYRIPDILAALGLSQLQRLDAFVARRHMLAARYDAALADLPLTVPYRDPRHYSALHLYPIRVKASERRRVFDGLRQAGVMVNVHYIPVHTQPYYQALGFKQGDFPDAEAYYAECISLPM